MIQESSGGKNMNFKFNIHPCNQGRAKLCDFGFARNLGLNTFVLTSIKASIIDNHASKQLIEYTSKILINYASNQLIMQAIILGSKQLMPYASNQLIKQAINQLL